MAEEQLITNPDAAISQRNQYPPQSGPENTRGNGVRVRRGIAAGFVVLLAAARMRYPALALGGQAAVSLSNYGQENITFWCNHTGLEQRPKLLLKAIGTAPIKQIDVIKNNTYIHKVNPNQKEAALEYVDNSAAAGESYYYVRVEQSEGQLAWSSPIWTQRK